MRQLVDVFKVERNSPASDPPPCQLWMRMVRQDGSMFYPDGAERDYPAHLRNAAVVKGQ